MVAIVRVLDVSSKILILDEPTSSLDETEVEQLFKVIRKLRDDGLAILFITHFLDQTYRISDRITILKNGEFVGEYKTDSLPKLDLIAKMLGKELSEFSFATTRDERKKEGAKAGADAKNVLRVRDLGLRGSIAPFDVDVSEGDVLGLAGLLGSGRTEMARLIFGIDGANQGEVFVKGRKTGINSPRSAMMVGMGFCSEDRKSEGIFCRPDRPGKHHPGPPGTAGELPVHPEEASAGDRRRAHQEPGHQDAEREQHGRPAERGQPAEADAGALAGHQPDPPHPG